jgi:hypothetical protein
MCKLLFKLKHVSGRVLTTLPILTFSLSSVDFQLGCPTSPSISYLYSCKNLAVTSKFGDISG